MDTGQEEKFYKITLEKVNPKDVVRTTRLVMKITNSRLSEAKNLVENVPDIMVEGLTMEDARKVQKMIHSVNASAAIEEDTEAPARNDIFLKIQLQESQNKRERESYDRCPACHSTHIGKLPLRKRLLLKRVFHLKSIKMVKMLQCKDCGYRWEVADNPLEH